ncbi:MAG TPA: cytochrome d ubiquinol oxidase subunit II [Bryobacteraceae bacterium]|nr:cytochrome d ubiquinol oxidase subunit II [Bryobacteraceae bacterium]
MEVLWFCLVAIMIAGYVVLDGFDFGVGMLHLFVARNDAERRQVLGSIGPVWDGNEVWLLAGGGTLYFAFPSLYSSAFSGFYLALMIVLWLLILRGIAIEFRNHIDSNVWRPFWDTVFCGASAVLALVFGVALGNVVRGVPLDDSGFFFVPLWVNLSVGHETGIIDWYTLLVGLTAFAALALHGSLWIALKTTGAVYERATRMASTVAWPVALLTLVITWFSFLIQPNLGAQFGANPWGFVFPAIALAGLIAAFVLNRRGSNLGAFAGSSAFLVGMLCSAAFGVFPYVLPSNGKASAGLTIYNAAAAHYGLVVGLWWWIPGMLLAAGYSIFTYRQLAGRVQAE